MMIAVVGAMTSEISHYLFSDDFGVLAFDFPKNEIEAIGCAYFPYGFKMLTLRACQSYGKYRLPECFVLRYVFARKITHAVVCMRTDVEEAE